MLAAVLLFPVQSLALSAQKSILLNPVSGNPIIQNRCDEKSLIASTTKIMTALIVCEQCNVLDRMVIPAQATGIEGSSMYLRPGEVLTIQELLYGLMLSSGNDAAVALALYCSGGVDEFCGLMNDKARELGMKNTHFSNPNGLDDSEHYSSARDLAILSAYAMENPIFAKTVSTKTLQIGSRYLRNHNKLLWQYDGADGIKTGYTKAAGRILASSAVRDGRRLIAVTINAPNDWEDHKALLNTGFSKFQNQTIIQAGQTVGRLEVSGGNKNHVSLAAAEDFNYSLMESEEAHIVPGKKGFVYAPVQQGDSAGYAYVVVCGKAVGKIPIVYAESVELQEMKKHHWWQKT